MNTLVDLLVIVFLGLLCLIQLLVLRSNLKRNKKIDLFLKQFDSIENTLINLSRGSLGELKSSIAEVLAVLKDLPSTSEIEEIIRNIGRLVVENKVSDLSKKIVKKKER